MTIKSLIFTFDISVSSSESLGNPSSARKWSLMQKYGLSKALGQCLAMAPLYLTLHVRDISGSFGPSWEQSKN